MKCKSNIGPCSGQMIIRCQHTKKKTFVAAHKLPIFAQCNMCGFAPLPKDQPSMVKEILEKYLEKI